MINADFEADNTKSIEVLGMEYKIDMRQTVIEMGYSLIEQGIVPKKTKK